ncbi:MAG: DUF4091 domain-containing protein [Thermoguttaceae bacterium]|nr:DUF4091 domain-containing protein [Thermoguttaceae bacterium]
MKRRTYPDTKRTARRLTVIFCAVLIFHIFSLAVFADTEWHTQLNGAEDGFWKYRIPIRLSISDEQRAELERRNAELGEPDAEKNAKDLKADPQAGMNSKLTPYEFRFTVVTPEGWASASQEKREKLLPMAGRPAEEVRVCDEHGVEYLFSILDPQRVPQTKGCLRPDSSLTIPIELTTIPQETTFYVYFGNPKAWELPDWWSVRTFFNGNFEEGELKVSGWDLDVSDAEHQIFRTDELAKEGRFSIKTIVAKGAEHTWIGARQSAVPVKPGQRWRMTGWTKVEGVEGYAGWFYHVGNAAKPMMGSGMLYAGAGTYDWKQTSAEFTVPEGADRVTIGTVLRGTGTAWADDVRMELLSDPGAHDLEISCTAGSVEKFPFSELYPSRTLPGGTEQWDAVEFFGTEKLPRFAFIRIMNASDEVRVPLVNVSASQIGVRWGIEIDPASVEVLGLDGRPLPFETWGMNFFVSPELPPRSVTYLLLCEKKNAVSRKETAQKKRDAVQNDSGFPGTSLQQVSERTQKLTKENVAALTAVLTKNLVQDPGFEELDAAGHPIAWTNGPTGPGISFNVPDPQAEGGILGRRCAETRFESGARPSWNGWRQTIPVQANRTYFCGAWMKYLEDSGNLTIHAHFHTADHQLCASGGMVSCTSSGGGANEWALVSGMLKAPQDAAFMVLQLTIDAPKTFCCDNVFVTEMELGALERFQGGEVGIFQVPPIIKVFPDSTWPQNPEELQTYAFRTVSTAKNEEETIQFAFRWAEDKKFQIAMSPAVSRDGKTVLPTELFAVGYVPVKHVTSYYNTRKAKWFRKLPNGIGRADGWGGRWPDPLIRFPNLNAAANPENPANTANTANTANAADPTNVADPARFTDLNAARAAWKVLENAEYSSDSERLRRFAEQDLLGFRANETRALAVIVKTPKEIPAGVYSGKILLRDIETGKVTSVPFSVDVKDFAIPDEPVCTAIYDCRASHIEYWHESNAQKLVENMVDFLASKRLAPDKIGVEPKFKYDAETGKWTADFAEFDAACEKFFHELKIQRTYLPGDWYCFGWGMPPRARQGIQPYEGEWPFEGVDRSQLRPEFKKVYQDKLRLFWDHLKEKGWDEHFVLYISDEPFYYQPHIITQMIACCEMIHEVDPNIPIYSSTWGHVPEWDGHINVWGIGHYGRVPEEQIRKSKARGDRIWWTTNGQMCTDTPYCASERMLPYWCMKYGADAYEFWGASWYTYDPYQYGWHSYIYQTDQPGVEYYVLYPNGDGYIFYPDKLLGVNEFVSTIRLEQAREGVEDAAYIQIFREEIARVKALEDLSLKDAETLQNAENTLARLEDLVHIPNAGGRFSSHNLPNPEEVDEVKELMLRLIMELKGI